MRQIVFAAAFAGAAWALSACSGGSEESSGATAEPAGATAANGPSGSAGAATADAGAVLDANSATIEGLTGAGVTDEVAAAIVTGRPYSTVADLNKRLGQTLSGDAAGEVLESVFVPVNLNTASREQIELIPGITDRMVGEFLEYRPYDNMDEFDREIGKYVDEAEVARFRRYVTL